MTIRMRDDILANQITYYNGLIAKTQTECRDLS